MGGKLKDLVLFVGNSRFKLDRYHIVESSEDELSFALIAFFAMKDPPGKIEFNEDSNVRISFE